MQDNHFTFLKNPGYIRDLLYIFSINFCKMFIQTEDHKTNINSVQVIEQICNQFGATPEKLYLFFNVDCKSPCFLMQEYFNPWMLNTPDLLNFDTFYQQLKDKKQFSQRLSHYYFPELDIDCALFNGTEFNDIVLGSNLPDRVRLYLYHYFCKPHEVHQLLLNELKNKESLLRAYYSKHCNEIESFVQHFNETTFRAAYLNLDPSTKNLFQKETQYYTLSLLCEYYLADYSSKQHAIFLIGLNSKLVLERMIYNQIDLFQIHQCLADKSRYTIIKYLWEHNTISGDEIYHLLHIKPPAVSNLIKVLMNARLIERELHGNSYIYRLNDAYINTVFAYIHYLEKSRKELS